VTPFLTARAATLSLVLFGIIYVFIFSFGTFYIYRLLRAGPTVPKGARLAVPNRPMSLAAEPRPSRDVVLTPGE
jgi:cytochrome bd ubiquinol oxidase subunit I